MIEDYLNTIDKDPPSFLIPLHEYHKKLKRRYPTDSNINCQDADLISETFTLNIGEILEKVVLKINTF